jgi:hypothetical protein
MSNSVIIICVGDCAESNLSELFLEKKYPIHFLNISNENFDKIVRKLNPKTQTMNEQLQKLFDDDGFWGDNHSKNTKLDYDELIKKFM